MVAPDQEQAPTLWRLLEERAAKDPHRPAFVDERERRLTFEQLRARAERVAAGLLTRGISSGSAVTWQLPTRIEAVALSLALSRLDAVQNPVIPIYGEREVRSLLRQTRARLLVVPGPWRGVDYPAIAHRLAAERPEPLDVLVVEDELPEGDPATLPPPAEDPHAVRWIYATSGTTSEPKGVRHTDASLIAAGRAVAVAYESTADDVMCIPFPYAHIGGADSLVLALVTGLSHLLLETFDPPAAVALHRKHGVTMTGGSTAFYLAFLAEQRKSPNEPVIPTLRAFNGGGAPMPPEVYWQVRREIGVPVFHGYGMTECPLASSGSPSDSDEQRANSEGRPADGLELRITGPDGEVLPPGEDGDIRLRGPSVCRGYTDDALNAEAFDADGFLETGDRGHLRPDGHLRLTGRTKDLIIRKGENISPREVEDVLQSHPKVAAVAVIGLPDEARGERVCAVVETAPGAQPLTFPEMQQHCEQEGLSRRKFPEQLEVVEALPRNPTMKVLKTELRMQFG